MHYIGNNTVLIVYDEHFNKWVISSTTKLVEIVSHREMFFAYLQQLVVDKIGNVSNFMKKDLVLIEDNDIRGLFHLISNGVEQYCSLITHSTSNLSIAIDNRYPIETSIDICSHDEEGCFANRLI